jgi:hypothetical protein
MANPNAPRGIIPYAYRSGAPYNGAVRTYYVPVGNSTALYIGDPVVLITNSSDGNGIQTVEAATAGATNNGGITYAVLGSFAGRSNNAGQTTIPVLQSDHVYLPAATAGYIYVADDPTLLYWAQEDSVGGALVSGASGRNVSLVAGTSSNAAGYSGWQIQSSTLSAAYLYQMRIVQLLQEADNAVGVNAKWLTFINNHPFNSTTGI